MENTYMYIQPQENTCTLIVYIGGMKKHRITIYIYIYVLCGFRPSMDFFAQTMDLNARYTRF